MEAKLTHIPNFLEARSKKDLVLECAKNNERLGMYVHYFDFQEQKDGMWVCWYFEDLTDAILSQAFRKRTKL